MALIVTLTNDTQHNGTQYISVPIKAIYTECHLRRLSPLKQYKLSAIMSSAIMLIAIMLSAIMLSVILLSVAAPFVRF
jgi:hypothetical protein